MSIQRLVVNGCSYMESYSNGAGHQHLAQQLHFTEWHSLALGGSPNSRIIRTTLKDSYLTDTPTMYILGMTFISRSEVPILRYTGHENEDLSFEGRWTNPQNQSFENRWHPIWTNADTKAFVDLKVKSELYSLLDRTEDLMYQLLSLIGSLQNRGHRVLIYQQADDSYIQYMGSPRLSIFKNIKEIINGFCWQATQWQHSVGVAASDAIAYNKNYPVPKTEIKHRKPGEHQKLNEFLINYIKEYKILE